ncbi:MAG: choice-of-anchor J domain-containing protein [Bacteroidota bacterium]
MSAFYRILIVVAAIMSTVASYAQERCGTDIIEKKALLKNPNARVQFEQWMKNKLVERSSPGHARDKTNLTYIIPVVVHIIHNGEAPGSGSNIPDAQVQSQIRVLNEDYHRLNADAANTPAEFAPFASSIDIQFVLAKQDPDGLPTNGITRTLGSRNSYTDANDTELKALSYWPSQNYLNIWVTNLGGGFLGYAHFPITSLQGTDPPYDAATDGVVIHYKAFGSQADGSFGLMAKYNLGRTTTHEVGHYLGLLHIFGDFSGCSTTDYVDDTPIQSDRTFTCPSAPLTQCGHHVMFQDYMDYTDDACMNLFTAGQIARIQTVMDNSPRRVSLSSSPGSQDPTVLALDLEAKTVVAPLALTCGQSIVPQVTVRNRGTTTITSVKVNFVLNGSTVETKTFSVNLNNLDAQTLSFSTTNLTEPSTNTVSFNILEVNGGTDNNTGNNTVSTSSQVNAPTATPFLEAFNSTPTNWLIVNPDNSTTWMNVTAPKATATNKAMYIDLFNYQSLSAKDQLISPFINIPSGDAILKFDRAYAMYNTSTIETLRVLVSAGCSTDLSAATEVYNASGSALATAATTTSKFVPTGESQWASTGISLSAYAGKVVRIIFESTNQNGNELYLDNVQVNAGEINDVKVISFVAPGPVFCDPKTKPVIAVQNLGTQTVTKLLVVTEVNGAINASQTLTGLSLSSGATANITLEALNLKQASNIIKITISDPDAIVDDNPADNVTTVTRVFNTTADDIPLRQNFDGNAPAWTIYSDGSQPKWQATSTTLYNNGLVYKAYSDATIGDQSWVVSPVLDLSKANQGSLFFGTSYGARLGYSDNLKVMVSEDCGITYDQLIFEKEGLDLSNQTVSTEWTPTAESDWTNNYISINDFAGKKNIRFAFIATNGKGNDIYLDNIEFFVEDNPDPPKTDALFSVYNSESNPYEFYITFNLPDKQDARLVVYNTIGQVLIDSQLPEALNQTYTVNLYGQSTGIYIARLQTPSRTSSTKLFVGK